MGGTTIRNLPDQHPTRYRSEFLSQVDTEHALIAEGNAEYVTKLENMSVSEYYDVLYTKHLQATEIKKMYKSLREEG